MDNHLTTDHEFTSHSLIWLVAMGILGLFVWIVGSLIWQGLPHLSWDFFTSSPQQAGRAGGIAPILVSTFWILGVCVSVSLPIGVGTAILLAETPNHQQGFPLTIRRSLDVLAGMPSIVIGLFGNAFFLRYPGPWVFHLIRGVNLSLHDSSSLDSYDRRRLESCSLIDSFKRWGSWAFTTHHLMAFAFTHRFPQHNGRSDS